MENIQAFSIKRVFLLMQKTAYENAKFVLIGLSTIFGIFSVVLFFNALQDGTAWKGMQSFYVAGFVISGLVISGMAFTNLRTKEKTMSFLTLPASTLEKLTAEILITTVVFVIGYTVIFFMYNLVVMLVGEAFNISTSMVDLFHAEVLKGFLIYVILQSIFLAGAATFRKAPLFFTSFSLFIVGVAILIIVVVFAFIFKENLENTTVMPISIGPEDFESDMENSFLLYRLPKFMFYYITAPIFWTVAYFKLKEKEV